MSNFIKLTQNTGKALMVEPSNIIVVESITAEERENFSEGFTGVWIMTESGQVASAVLSDKFGWLVRQLTGVDRAQLSGKNGKKFSMPSRVIAGATEVEDGTLLNTRLQSAGGPLRFSVIESVDEIFDILGITTAEVVDPANDQEN